MVSAEVLKYSTEEPDLNFYLMDGDTGCAAGSDIKVQTLYLQVNTAVSFREFLVCVIIFQHYLLKNTICFIIFTTNCAYVRSFTIRNQVVSTYKEFALASWCVTAGL